MQVKSLCQEDPLEKVVAAHSSILAWRIPRAEDPGRHPGGHKELDTTEYACTQTQVYVSPSLTMYPLFLLMF